MKKNMPGVCFSHLNIEAKSTCYLIWDKKVSLNLLGRVFS
jgi:hypothetical protein